MKRIIMVLLLIGLVFTSLYAQLFIEIGDGTETSPYIPCYGYFNYSWSNYILTAQQIGNAISINEIQFEVGNTPSSYTMNNQQLYLKQTTANEVSSAYPNPANNGFTLVYDGSITWNEGGWQGVILDTEFSFDGTSNLQIVWLNNNGSYASSYPNFLNTVTGLNTAAYKYADNSFPASDGTLQTYFPNTRLGFYPEGAPGYPVVVSPVNNSLNNDLDTDLVWTNGENTEFIHVYLSENREDVLNNEESALVVDGELITSFTTTLEYATVYYWKVVASNSISEYNISTNINSFTTDFNFSGHGTEENPYLINNLDDLIILSRFVQLCDKHFLQTADIDASATSELNDGAGFSPIGYDYEHSFTGSYNGQGYAISNLYINRPSTGYIGLFGYTQSAEISNLGIVDAEIVGYNRVGGLVGRSNSSTISNSYSTGAVSGYTNVGGLVGSSSSSTISNSYATGAVSGNQHIGGLVGYAYSTISNSYSTGAVSGNERVGGLVGRSDSSTISNSYSTGAVSGSFDVGGLVGELYSSSTISNSFWDMETSGQANSAGGTGKTTAEMQDINTYVNAGWDFDTIWAISEKYNDGYPYLAASWQPTLPVELTSFIATMTSNYFSQILWSTASETNLVGFNIYRSDNRNIESASRINRIYIPVTNSSHGSDYSYIDETVEMNSTYYYWLESTEFDGFVELFGPLSVSIGQQTGQIGPLITVSHIKGNYPNPFNPETTIEFFVQANETAQLTIYNLKGQIVRSPELFGAGKHRHYWNGTDNSGKQVASGIYLYRLKTESYESVRKMIIKK